MIPSLNDDNERAPQRRPSRLFVGAILVFLSLIVFAERWHTRTEPLERDQPTYAIVAQEMLNGVGLYSGVPDQKPPGAHAVYAAAELIWGYDRTAVFALSVTFGILILFGVYQAARRLFDSQEAGLWAASVWTVIGADCLLQANQPNTEAIMNACLVWGIAAIAPRRDREVSLGNALAAGALFAFATYCKPVVIASVGAICLGAFLFAPSQGQPILRRLRPYLIVAASIAALWLGTVAYFALHGRLGAFYDCLVVYNRYYAGNISNNVASTNSLAKLLPSYLEFAIPVFAVIIAGAVLGLRMGTRPAWAIIVAFAIGTAISVALPGRFYPHYYQLWLPVLCLGFGGAIRQIATYRSPYRLLASRGVAVLILALTIAHEFPFYRMSPDEWSVAKYGDHFVVANRAARIADRILRPSEVLYDASDEPEIYLATRRRPLTPIYGAGETCDGPLAKGAELRLLADLAKRSPDLVIGTPLSPINPQTADWLAARYAPVRLATPLPNFIMLVRRGSALEARLATQPPL